MVKLEDNIINVNFWSYIGIVAQNSTLIIFSGTFSPFVIYMGFNIWYCSMASRQVFDVPSASVGGSLYSIAVCSRGADMQKVIFLAFLPFFNFVDFSVTTYDC